MTLKSFLHGRQVNLLFRKMWINSYTIDNFKAIQLSNHPSSYPGPKPALALSGEAEL